VTPGSPHGREDFHTALSAAVFSAVQASGQISVRALVRGPESAQRAPIRALTGAQGPCPSPSLATQRPTGPPGDTLTDVPDYF
jgi:hypothetical protein